MPRRYDPSEPRRADLARPWKYYSSESSLADLASMASMACSGLAMITRFPIWPWIGLLLAISGITSAKSLGTNKKTGESGGMLSGWSSLMFAATALFSIYAPILLLQAAKAPNQAWPFGFNKGLVFLNQQQQQFVPPQPGA